MINSIILACALICSLFIQGTNQPIYILTVALVILSSLTGVSRKNTAVYIWLAVLFISGFYLAPVNELSRVVITSIKEVNGRMMAHKATAFDGTALLIFASLCFMPVIALTAHKKAILSCFMVVVGFAAVLIYQFYFEPDLMYRGKRAAWPMSNPNNAASVVIMALVPAVCWFIKTRKVFLLPCIIILLYGLICTFSKGAIIAAAIAIGLYVIIEHKRRLDAFVIVIASVLAAGSYVGFEKMFNSFTSRFPIWESSVQMVSLKGTGVGTFYKHYKNHRIEQDTDGFFTHNDILQFAIELGAVGALVFVGLFLLLVIRTNRENLVPFCSIFAVFIHSQISYPLYVVPVNIGLGVLLTYWFISTKESKNEKINLFNISRRAYFRLCQLCKRG